MNGHNEGPRYGRGLACLVALLAALIGLGFLVTSPAQADAVHTSTVEITNTPDDGCPEPWARDTFKRTTTITAGDVAGTYKVAIADEGTFTTQVGAASPGDSAVPISMAVTGDLQGDGEFTVTGALKDAVSLAILEVEYDNSEFDCKSDVPVERTTSKWPLRYFTDATLTFDSWTWKYETACESRTESSTGTAGGEGNNITGKVCSTPSADPTSTPSEIVSPTASASPSASNSPTQTPTPGPITPTTPGETPDATPTTEPAVPVGNSDDLPTTGGRFPWSMVFVSVALLSLGGALLTVAYRRHTTATA